MARRGKKKGRPVSGWLILDKPAGMGSTDAVAKVKWLFQAEKAGHAGTLDPLASGMLPIALGEATKTVPYVQDGAKVYRFTVAWGEERSTDDLEGPVTKSADKRPTEAEIRGVMPTYTGVIMQTPPQFSAIKIAGERAYDLARDGAAVDIPAREVEIGRLDLVEHSGERTVFEVECGKGTYVRSLARDMGRDLGCFGHIAELRRTEVDPFTAEDLVTLAELEEALPLVQPVSAPVDGAVAYEFTPTPNPSPQGGGGRSRERFDQNRQSLVPGSSEGGSPSPLRGGVRGGGVKPYSFEEISPPPPRDFTTLDALLLDTGEALDCLPQVAVSDDAASKIRLGNAVIIRGRDAPVEAEEACATARGKLVAIGAIEQGMFKPRRVFAG